MKKEQLLEILLKIPEKQKSERFYDAENAHLEADTALIEFINDKEIEDAYEKIDKWYA